MSQSLVEIEENLLECLKSMSCPPLKNVLNIESNKTIKDILIDPAYLEEKLNLFIWLILKFEPRFSSDYSDCEFYSAETKCRKVLDGLSTLGLIDIHEFGIDKLMNTSIKNYKELLLIANDLNDLLQSKTHSQQSLNADDILSLDLISIGQFNQYKTSENDYLNEIIAEKLQILDDPNFFKEYKNVLQHGTTNLIPSEMNRIIKVVNDNSCYASLNFNREDLAAFLSNECLNIDSQIEEINKSFNKYALVNLEDQEGDANEILNEFKNELAITRNQLKEMNSFIENLTNKSNVKDSLNPGVESNFGKSFYDLDTIYSQFQKFKSCLMDWSSFFKTHSQRLEEFKTNNVIDQESYLNTINFNQQLKNCDELLGQSQSKTKTYNSKALKLNTNANETVVDQLLLL